SDADYLRSRLGPAEGKKIKRSSPTIFCGSHFTSADSRRARIKSATSSGDWSGPVRYRCGYALDFPNGGGRLRLLPLQHAGHVAIGPRPDWLRTVPDPMGDLHAPEGPRFQMATIRMSSRIRGPGSLGTITMEAAPR